MIAELAGFLTVKDAPGRYALELPDTFHEIRAENGERRFEDPGGARLLARAWSTDLASADEFVAAKRAWAKSGRITYAVSRPGMFVVSGFVDDGIFYERTIISADRAASVTLEYPKATRTRFDRLVARVTRSLRLTR